MSGAYRSSDATVAAHGAVIVATSDATTIPVTRALYVGGSGDLNVRMADDQIVLFTAVPVGIFPIQVDQILATSTTATNIVALY
jgi:hypothetical protein